MIKKFLFLAAILLLASPINASQCNLLQNTERSSKQNEDLGTEFNGVEYPDEVYPWFKYVNADSFPKEMKRFFMEPQARTELEPLIKITKDSDYFDVHEGFRVDAVTLSSDSRYLAYAMLRDVFILNLETLQNRLVFTGWNNISALLFTPDDSKLVIIESSSLRKNLHFIEKDAEYVGMQFSGPPQSFKLFSETEVFNGCIGSMCTDFIGDDIVVMDDAKRVYRFNFKEKVRIPTWEKQQEYDAQLYKASELCKIRDSSNILMVTGTVVDQFNFVTKEWSKPLGDMTFPYKPRFACDVEGKWLALGETLIDLETQESRTFSNEEINAVKFSSDKRFIFCQNAIYSSTGLIKQNLRIVHRNTGACFASGNKGLPLPMGIDTIFNEKFIINWDTDGLIIYPVRLIWKYHAAFQEGKCSLPILMFIKFLDDLHSQGMILTKNGIQPRLDLLVKIIARDLGKDHRIYEITGPRTWIYPLLKKAQLKIIKADVQKIAGYKYKKPVPRNLSDASLEKLSNIWSQFSQAEKDDLYREYGTCL